MSSKKEEKAAFKRLKKAFPGESLSLTCFYASWIKRQSYYVTVNDIGSTVGDISNTADEAVDLMIKMKEGKI
jgi:hypothetical protein